MTCSTSTRRRRRFSSATISALLLIATAIAGCGPSPQGPKDRATVSGIVTLDGQPLPGGTLNFQSTQRPVGTTVLIKAGGVYTTNRAPLGENVVTIETASLQVGGGGAFVRIPDRYNDTQKSGLVIDVKPGANENVDFALQK